MINSFLSMYWPEKIAFFLAALVVSTALGWCMSAASNEVRTQTLATEAAIPN